MMLRESLAALAGFLVLSMVAAAAAPTCGLVPGWTAQAAARSYGQDNLFEYMDGNAEGYVLYGFQTMQGITCEKGGVTLVIDISDFGDADSAYGMFTNSRDPGQATQKIGMSGQIVPRRALFVKGRYYVEIAANPVGDYSAMLHQWAVEIDRTLEGSAEPPAALGWFPKEGQRSLRLVPESVLGLRLLTRGYVAEYDFGKAFAVTESSPASAAALMQKLRARFPGNTLIAIGEEAFQAADRYLGKLCIFRTGSYVAGYSNLAETQDGSGLAKGLLQRLHLR